MCHCIFSDAYCRNMLWIIITITGPTISELLGGVARVARPTFYFASRLY